MKNTNSKEYKAQVKEYLTPIIIDALEAREKSTEGNIFAAVIECARCEVKHEFNRKGQQGGLAEWLQGLGMGIDYMNYDIVQLAEKWHGCKLTDKQAEKVIEMWWSHIAFKMIQFSRG